MKYLFENVQTISDIVCTDDAGYCKTATSCNEGFTDVKGICTKDDIRKNLKHSIETLLGSTMDQAFQAIHNICSLTTTSEQSYFDKSKGSTLSCNCSKFGNKRNCSSNATILLDNKLSNKHDRLSNNYILEILIDDPDKKEFGFDPISPMSLFSFNEGMHNLVEEFEDPNKPLQFSNYQENDSLMLSTIFSEDKENQNRYNHSSNYDTGDDGILRVSLVPNRILHL